MNSHIQISGCNVIPIPLFETLDGKTTSDYVARVEPSCTGGRKIAECLLEAIECNTESPNLMVPKHDTMERKDQDDDESSQ